MSSVCFFQSAVLCQHRLTPEIALVQSTLIGIAVPEDVPPDVYPFLATIHGLFFTTTGPTTDLKDNKCSHSCLSRDAVVFESNDLLNKPPDDDVVK